MSKQRILQNECYLIGLGAAAGGLTALKQFFQALPLTAQFSFVVISLECQASQLAQYTQMPVHELDEGMSLQPGSVYLLTQTLVMKGNKVLAAPKPAPLIDSFFHALAQEHGERAIAIILSGNGNDGSQGIGSIKQHHGQVMIQTPSSAEFNSMPQSALNTGQFDWVLLPEAMPAALMHIIHPRHDRHYIDQLEHTLAATRQTLQTTLKQLEIRNRIVQSTEKQLVEAHNTLEATHQEWVNLNSDYQDKIQQLQKNKEILAHLLRSSRVGTVFLDQALKVHCFNLAIHQQINLLDRDIDQPFEHIVHHFNYPNLLADLKAVMLSAQPRDIEVSGANGRLYLLQLSPYFSSQGQVEGALLNFIDITTHKHTELALRNFEERLQLATSIGEIGICEWNLRSGALFWDEMTFQLYGLDPNQCQLSYETWSNSLHPEDRQAIETQLTTILAGEQERFDLQFRIIRPDGCQRYIHARVQVHRDLNGQPLSVLGINWDVTEEIQACQALQDSEERFRLITETIQDVFWMSTPGVQEMLYVSPAYEQIWGRSCASLYQNPRSFFDAVHPEDKEQLIQGLIDHGHGKWAFEYRIITPQGEIRWIRDRGYPIFGAQGELRLMTGTASDITAIKQTEQLLKNTQRLAHIGSWVLDVATSKTVWTEEVYRIHELAPNMPTNVEMGIQFYHPDEQPRIRQAVAEAIANGTSWDMECRFITAKGRPLWVRVYGEAVYLHDKVSQLQGYFQDITAYKTLEIQLRHSHDELLRYLNQPLIGMLTAQADKTFINANACFCNMIGYSLAELQQLTWEDISYNTDLNINTDYFNRLMAGEIDFYQFEKRYVHKQGHLVWAQLAISCVRNEQGQVIYLIGFVQDITERQQIQRQLQDTLARQQAIFANSGAGIAIVNAQRCFLEINQRWQKILGYSAAELMGQSTSMVHIDEEHYRRFGAQVVTELPYHEVTLEYPLKHKNGSIVWCQVSLNTVIQGDLTQGIIVLIVDISELYYAREKAQAANQAKSQFLAHMSHELRTPLNAIMGYAQILGTDTTLPIEVREKIMIMEHSGEHLLTLINDILDLSKIEAGRLELVLGEVQLQHLFDEVVHLFELRAQQQGLRFRYERHRATSVYPGFPTLIRADEKRVRQVLLNLLSNAIKFTAPGGWVSLRVEYLTGSMRIAIADSGCGIAESELEFIFQPFRQVGNQNHQEGTGLGLPICRQLVALMGGTLNVTSTLGQGSVFSFEIPLQVLHWDEQALLRALPSRTISGYQGARKKVLVVDDILANQAVLIDFLQPLGFHVLAASSCHQALQIIANWIPDIVFMDLQMPTIDGFDCTHQLRQHSALKHTVIFALSASVLSEQKQQAQQAGCDAFLDKPFETETLLTALSHYCGIEWITRESESAATDTLIPPPAAILAELSTLLRSGEIKSIKQLLASLEDNALVPFREQALSLINQFKINELKKLITQLYNNPPKS